MGNIYFKVANKYLFLIEGIYMCYALQGNVFQDASTKEDLKLGFKYGFKSVIEYQKSLG